MLSTSQCHQLIFEAYNRAGGLESAKAIIEMPPGQHLPPEEQPQNIGVPSWCICGKCRPMPTPENKCCRHMHSKILANFCSYLSDVSFSDDSPRNILVTFSSLLYFSLKN